MKNEAKTILVVEDDRDISELMRLIIETEGYKVIKLLNADNIFSIVLKEKPALIIMDLHIGSVDGAEIVRKFKQSKEIKKIPVILVSAKNSLEEIAENAGAEGFLAKPFDIKDLTELIHRLV